MSVSMHTWQLNKQQAYISSYQKLPEIIIYAINLSSILDRRNEDKWFYPSLQLPLKSLLCQWCKPSLQLSLKPHRALSTRCSSTQIFPQIGSYLSIQLSSIPHRALRTRSSSTYVYISSDRKLVIICILPQCTRHARSPQWREAASVQDDDNDVTCPHYHHHYLCPDNDVFRLYNNHRCICAQVHLLRRIRLGPHEWPPCWLGLRSPGPSGWTT